MLHFKITVRTDLVINVTNVCTSSVKSIVNVTLVRPSAPRYWQEAQKLCLVVSQRLAEAQSEAESLETKYTKAKKLVREYQRRYGPSLVH